MSIQAVDVTRFRAQAAAATRARYEKGKRWARRDLPQWHRTIRWTAWQGETCRHSGQLIPALIGSFCSIFGPMRSTEFMIEYARELQAALGEEFTVRDSTNYRAMDGPDWEISISW